jgi:ligand-binding sensor domain-containing protein
MKKYTAVLFCFFLCYTVRGEKLLNPEYSYRRYTTADGLPTSIIECCFQDSRGFMWFGTQHGAVLFDGVNFKPILGNKALPINKIEEKDNGEIVIYGYYFIYIYNPKTEQLRQTYRNKRLNYYVENSHGLPWGYSLVTQRYEEKLCLYYLQGDTLAEMLHTPLFDKMGYGQSIYYDIDNHIIYVPTAENELYIIDEEGNIKKRFDNITVLRFLKKGNELLGFSKEGVWKITTEHVKEIERYETPINNIEDISVIMDKNGEIYIRDYKSVSRYKQGKFEIIVDKINIPRSLFIDRENNLWLASRQGLYNFFKLDIKSYKVNEQTADIVNSILITGKDAGFFATGNGKLIRFQEDKYKEIHYPQQRSGTSFMHDPLVIDDKIYFTTSDNVLEYRNGAMRWMNFPPNIYFVASGKVSDNKYFIGGWESLFLVDKNFRKTGTISHAQIERPTIYTAEADNEGRIWIGGHEGICRISDKDTVYFYSDATQNTEGSYKDHTGKIWFVSENHIYYTGKDTIKLYKKFDNQILTSIIVTKDNMLVVTTARGIKIFDIDADKMVEYGYDNGFPALEPAWLTIATDEEGNVWLGTQSSHVLKFNPKMLLERKNSVILNITKIETSRNNIDWQPIVNLEKLKPGNKNIRISFAGLCYSNPTNVRHYYRLRGFQDEWSRPTALREITFNNLPPGDYVFEMYADAGTDDSSSAVQSYAFSITPAFWQTAWFTALCILFLMLLSAGIALYIQQRKNKVLLEKLETEKQLNELRIKSIRLKAIPHFNANVLAAIEYYIMNRSKDEAIRLLGIYARFTFQTLREVDKASRSLTEELEYVKMYLELEKLRFVDKFDYEIDIDSDVNTDVQLPNMILHTYCENAVKHGLSSKQSGGMLTVKAIRLDDRVCVSVEDNGVGREAAANNKNIPSSKQGLDILSQQITIYNRFNHTKINQMVDDLHTPDGQPCGTRFTVEVPLDFVYQ